MSATSNTPSPLSGVLDTLADLVMARLAPKLAERMPKTVADFPEWMDTATAAEYLGLRRNTLEVWRAARKGPRFSKPTRSVVRYKRADLDEWLAAGGARGDRERKRRKK